MTHPCSGCRLHGVEREDTMERRAFLRVAAGAALASFGALGLATAEAFALPVVPIGALPPRAGERAQISSVESLRHALERRRP